MRKRRTRTRSKEGTLRVWLLLSDIINLYGGWGRAIFAWAGEFKDKIRQFFFEFRAG